MQFLKRILFIDLLKGLWLTFQYTFKPVYTEQYPTERPKLAARYKGAPRLNNDPATGETLCIACDLCALICPEDLIVVGAQRDPESRKKVLTTYTFDTSRCHLRKEDGRWRIYKRVIILDANVILAKNLSVFF